MAVQHVADVLAIEHGHGQEKPLAACIADGGIPLERLADAVPLADFQRVADDGAAAVREHAHALDAHAVDIIVRQQALPRVRALDADEVLHAHELGTEARVETVREHVDVHGDFLFDVRVEHRADALLQEHADDDEQHEEQHGEQQQRGSAAFELLEDVFCLHGNSTPSAYQSRWMSAASGSDSPSATRSFPSVS